MNQSRDSSTPTQKKSFLQRNAIPFFLFILTILVFSNAVDNELTRTWDDSVYIFNNPYHEDFPRSLDKMFSEIYFGSYLPLTLLTFSLEYLIWEEVAVGYRVLNILLHALGGVLVYYVVSHLFKRRDIGFLTALLFLIHPVNVASVVWISERKNVLSIIPFLLTFLLHIRSAEREGRQRWRYQIAAWWMFLVCMLTKNSAMGAFILFAAYDRYWHQMSLRLITLRNFPYLVLGAMGGGLVFFGHSSGNSILKNPGEGIWEDLLYNAWIYWDYLVAYIAPNDLTSFYVYDIARIQAGLWQMWAGLGLLTAIALIAIFQPFGKPYSRFSMLWIVILFAPVANIVPLFTVRMDHYMYYPSIMVFALFSWLAVRLIGAWKNNYWQYGGIAVVCLWLGAYAIITRQQSEVWQNDSTLWENHITVYPEHELGLVNASLYYVHNEDYETARAKLGRALEVLPDSFDARGVLASVEEEEGNYNEALRLYAEMAEIRPDDLGVEFLQGRIPFNEGLILIEQGQFAAGLDKLEAAQEHLGDHPVMFNNLGYAYLRLGNYSKAIENLQIAVEIESTYVRAQVNLGEAALLNEDFALAREAYEVAFQHESVLDAQTNSNYCLALLRTNGDTQLALTHCRTASNYEPSSGFYRARLAYALLQGGNVDEALRQARRATQQAEIPASYSVLAEVYAVIDDAAEETNAQETLASLSGDNNRDWLLFP